MGFSMDAALALHKIETHEKVCEERNKHHESMVSGIFKRIERIEGLMIATVGAAMLQCLSVIGMLVMQVIHK